MTERSTGLTRAQADVAAGRLWKARDRLLGVHFNRPADQDVLSLLGEVYHRMGDLPQAARFWFLTERTGDDVDAANAAFDELYGGNRNAALAALPLKAPLAKYPRSVRQRVEQLQSEAAAERPPSGRQRRLHVPESSLRETAIMAGLVVVTFGIWLVGLIWLIALLWRWIFGS